MGDLEDERGEGSQSSPTHHGSQHLLSSAGGVGEVVQRGEGIPGHSLTSYLGGILAPKPSAENFLSLQRKRCEKPQYQGAHHQNALASLWPSLRCPGSSMALHHGTLASECPSPESFDPSLTITKVLWPQADHHQAVLGCWPWSGPPLVCPDLKVATAGASRPCGTHQCNQPVIVLADLPHSNQRLEVLVGLVGVDVVQGAAVSGVSVGGREVDGHLAAGGWQ